MKKTIIVGIVATISTALFFTPAHGGWKPSKSDTTETPSVENKDVAETIAAFKEKDPGMAIFFEKAYGYAVFPKVGKGGIGIGGAHGKGEVYEQGKLIGISSLTQVTIGFQFGGQSYSEIIFFKDKEALGRFKGGNFELGAQASAVAASAGASSNAGYENGVAIFTLAKLGLMYEASIGGQKFSFKAK
ncbi:MAG TPA: YSC84-related protein [Candidatus Wujingus californicus]|uniref:YSC84-related protein n=2 Tax=Candidatus Wujingus californicus TaxID=3367618 RepID=UPI001D47E7E6|nr:hypothetical protein [Planctomycetota bacterium]